MGSHQSVAAFANLETVLFGRDSVAAKARTASFICMCAGRQPRPIRPDGTVPPPPRYYSDDRAAA